MSRDLKIDQNYGDFTLVGNDINIISGNKAKTEIAKERLRSNNNDFKLVTNYGTNLDLYMGSGITENLLRTMKTTIITSLTEDGLFPTDSVEVLLLQTSLHVVAIRVILTFENGEEETVSTTLYTEEEA